MSGEERLLSWLRVRGRTLGADLIGDDAAILPQADAWTVTMDTQIEGVHFPVGLSPERVAERLVRVNLSDLAAMGAQPVYAFLSLTGEREWGRKAFFDAFLRCCERFDFNLAGGDLTVHSSLVTVLTLLGRKGGQRWLRRSTAQPGETLWVGGNLGEAALGLALIENGWVAIEGEPRWRAEPFGDPDLEALAKRCLQRYLAPDPQLALGTWLAQGSRGAAIDLSDGLAKDLHRLCRESGVGAEVDLALLPVDQHFAKLAGILDVDIREASLHHGDDYVLLFTLPEGGHPPGHFPCKEIGRILGTPTVEWIDGDERGSLEPRGWDHLDE